MYEITPTKTACSVGHPIVAAAQLTHPGFKQTNHAARPDHPGKFPDRFFGFSYGLVVENRDAQDCIHAAIGKCDGSNISLKQLCFGMSLGVDFERFGSAVECHD